MRVTGEPLLPLPNDCYRATEVERISSRVPWGGPDRGVFRCKAGTGSRCLYLMTWGANATRETVESRRSRRWVWVGVVTDNGKQRDNFEEVL